MRRVLSCVLVASAAALAEGMVRAEVIAEGAKTSEVDADGPSWKRVLLAAGLGALAATGGAHPTGGPHNGLVARGPGLELATGAAWDPVVHTDHGLMDFAVDTTDMAEPVGLATEPATPVAEPDKLVTEPDELGKMMEKAYPWRSVYYSYMRQLGRVDAEVQTAVDGLVKLAHSEDSHVKMPMHMQAQIVQAFANLANSAYISSRHAPAGVSGLRAMIAGPSLPRGAATVALESLRRAAATTPEALDVLPELSPRLSEEKQEMAVQTLVWACTTGKMLSTGHVVRGAQGLGALSGEPAAQTAEVLAALQATFDTSSPEPGKAAVHALARLAEALPMANPLKVQAVDALAAVAGAHPVFGHKDVRAAAVEAMAGLTL